VYHDPGKAISSNLSTENSEGKKKRKKEKKIVEDKGWIDVIDADRLLLIQGVLAPGSLGLNVLDRVGLSLSSC
jgi:hypothetical protein